MVKEKKEKVERNYLLFKTSMGAEVWINGYQFLVVYSKNKTYYYSTFWGVVNEMVHFEILKAVSKNEAKTIEKLLEIAQDSQSKVLKELQPFVKRIDEQLWDRPASLQKVALASVEGED